MWVAVGLICRKKQQNKKSFIERKDSGEGRFFRSHSRYIWLPCCGRLMFFFSMSLRALAFLHQFCPPLTRLSPKTSWGLKVVVAGTQVEQEEQVTGDTPPGHLGCAVLMVENDLLRASRVKF